MKILIFLFATHISLLTLAQDSKGKFIYDRLYSPNLENIGGEDPTRRVSIYLPPSYDKSVKSYPVVYYLHGITQRDSSLIANNNIDKLLNTAIVAGKVKPFIFVMSDQYTLYRGSFYTNSSFTGNWSDFTAQDLVKYIDDNYRTLQNRESRGIAGHSMGGHGAIKLGMLFPDVFSSVYALSPYFLGLDKENGSTGEAYKQAQKIKSIDTLVTGYKYLNTNAVVAVGRAFSPNPNKPPFYADLPFTYSEEDSLIVNSEVLDLWNKNLPNEMVSVFENNLKKLKAIAFDWGNNDFFPHIPPTSKIFSQKLKNADIKHTAQEYIGSHQDKVYSEDGRFMDHLLPFFDTNLVFE